MLDVAALALELWDRYLSDSQRLLIAAGLGLPQREARNVVAFICGCHDLGKLSRFQECEATPWARVNDDLRADTADWVQIPHERASMHIVLELLAELGYDDAANDSPAVRMAQICGGHHGRMLQIDLGGSARPARTRAALGGPKWGELRRCYLLLIRHLTDARAVPSKVSVTAATLISGLGMVADRLASQRHYWLPKALAPAFGAGEHYLLARRDAAQWVERAGLVTVGLPHVPFAQAHLRLTAPNVLQASLMDRLPPLVKDTGVGIVVVTDATGTGKSVTALEAARVFNAHCGTKGVCWLLPTTATADAAWETLESYVRAHHPEHAPVALVHSHSWLNAAYTSHLEASATQGQSEEAPYPDDPHPLDQEYHDEVEGQQQATVPDGWLRGWDRALLAQFCVATIDQALMAALPVRNSALRLLALTGKTVVIDEAHAFTPFTQLQLHRLLHWLGAMNVPVVVLSATLPASTSDSLIRSYLTGAGHRASDLTQSTYAPAYPGWLFADASSTSAHPMDHHARNSHTAAQRRQTTLEIRPVRHRPLGTPGRLVDQDERLHHIAARILPLVDHGGCAAVFCATVSDAQDTYRYLRYALPWPDDHHNDLVLLHARIPGHRREALTRRVRTMFGPHGPRPGRGVVVTTSFLDVSLDIDVDLIVSDLASLARILQRLGRLWRFELLRDPDQAARPPWIRAQGAHMTVLNPVRNGATTLPPGWDTLEPAFLQHATAALLNQTPTRTLTLPDDVQHLVEQIHGAGSDFAHATEALQQQHTRHLTTRAIEEHLSAAHLIPPPGRVSSLADLHRQHLTPGNAATRLGTLPKRLLPCYRTSHGTLTLDLDGTRPLPQGPLRLPHIRTLLKYTLPVPAAWVARRTAAHAPPDAWRSHPLLADLVLLPHDTTLPHTAPPSFGSHTLQMDPDLGLTHRQASEHDETHHSRG